jgi:asparagine N-glycosylation enzyme membrane subunit Stt3
MASPSIVPAALSIIVTVGFLGVLICMMKGWLTTDSSDALLLMLGSLGTAWTSVMAFWFGTTRQSENKTTMLAAAPSVK